jgi:excisionase family DNA binding protein
MELLTIQEAARMLKVHPVTVRRFIANGRLKAVRVGRGVRVYKDAVDELAEPLQPHATKLDQPGAAGRPMTLDDPLFKLIGSATDAAPTDSSKKYEYLADAIAPKAP